MSLKESQIKKDKQKIRVREAKKREIKQRIGINDKFR